MAALSDVKKSGPVLITGASGFLGAWLAAALIERGEKVHALDQRDDRKLLRDLVGVEKAADVAWTTGDIRDSSLVERVVAESGVRAIAHLAAITIPPCRDNPALCFEINVIGHINVLEAARHHGVKHFVYTSSTAGLPRGALYSPVNIYGVTKRATEDISKVFYLEHGITSIGLRPNVVYGYGRNAGETAAISEAIRAAAEGRPYVMPYDGCMCFQYVEEVVDVILRCLAACPTQPVVSDITTTPETIGDVIAAIKAVEPAARIEVSGKTRPSPDIPLDNAPLKSLIGTWRHVPLQEGVKRTFDHYRARMGAIA